MKKICTAVFLFSFILIFASSITAQGRFGKIGKVFSKTEANVLFGRVLNSVQINVDQLREAVKNAGDYIYITVKNNQPVITNSRRQKLIRNFFMPGVSPDEKMMVFSKSAVQNLLDNINSSQSDLNGKYNRSTNASTAVSIETRGETTTLTAGAYTLEWALACPPNCP